MLQMKIKYIIVLTLFILLNIQMICAQNDYKGSLIQQCCDAFTKDNIVPLIGDTIISPLRIKKDYSFELDYSKSKRLIVDSIKYLVYDVVNNRRHTIYYGNQMIDIDNMKYRSICNIYVRCLDYSGSCSINLFNIETDGLTKDNPNRKFIFIHDINEYGTAVEVRFVN